MENKSCEICGTLCRKINDITCSRRCYTIRQKRKIERKCSICGKDKTESRKSWHGDVCSHCHNKRKFNDIRNKCERCGAFIRIDKETKFCRVCDKLNNTDNRLRCKHCNKLIHADNKIGYCRLCRRRYDYSTKIDINNKYKLRKKKDANFYLKIILRKRLKEALKNNQKIGSAIEDLGCTIEELKIYLESKFQPGMTWENRGIYGWHIDHIVPLSFFDLTDPEQLKKACHYTNLQPLWAEDNLRKSDSLPNTQTNVIPEV